MTVNIQATEANNSAVQLDVLALYRTMVTARVTNDILKTRKTQGRYPFYIGCAGHESMAAVAMALKEEDWMSLYYRDLAAWLQRTGDIYGPFREAYSRTTGPMCAGRNMPSHYSSKHHRILPTFSEVAALAPFAGGVGFSLKWHKSKNIIMFTSGDGGAATNDFNSLFRQVSVHQLPVLIVVEDNGWAITAPSNIQWGGSLVEWAKGGNVYAEEVDGTNAIETFQATTRLVDHIRSGRGPVLMHLRLGLLDPHSSSTDMKAYRTKEEIELTMATKDPVKNFGRWLIENRHIQDGDIERIRKEVRAELESAEAEILQESEPTAERVMQHVVYVPEWHEEYSSRYKEAITYVGCH